jgi:hypothetical protein
MQPCVHAPSLGVGERERVVQAKRIASLDDVHMGVVR